MRWWGLAALAALAAAGPAEAEWQRATSPHFVIYADSSPKWIEAFATRLERFDKGMRSHRNLPDPPVGDSNRLIVFVLKDVGAVQKLYGKGGRDVAGFYLGRATGSVAFTPRAKNAGGEYDLNEQIVLFHEYAHHFMLQNYPGAVPAWLVEGYAEFHSTARDEPDGSLGIGVPAYHRNYSLTGEQIPIDRLLTASVGELGPMDRDKLYGRGWLLTHYLSFERARAGQLRTYLAEINSGTASLDAARKAFGDLRKLDKDLNAYLARPRLHYHKLAPAELGIGKVEVRALTPAEAAVMSVRIRSKRGVDETTAKALVPLARAAAGPYPNDAFAQVTLAEAEYDAGNLKEAEAAADRAIAADPKSVEALVYKGRARMALAVEAEAADPKVWADVRHWFRAANRLDPEDPEPLMLFYASFGASGAKPTANAAAGLAYALTLAPQDHGLRWMTAHQHLQDGKAKEARAALAPLAFDPHGGESAKQASSIVAKLDAEGAAAALAAWEKFGEKAEPEAAK
jgi:tetratricopeptide (TPR) repeat protein